MYLTINGIQSSGNIYWAEYSSSGYRYNTPSDNFGSSGSASYMNVNCICEVRLNIDYSNNLFCIVKYEIKILDSSTGVPTEQLNGFVVLQNVNLTQLGLTLGGSLLFTAASTWVATCINQY